ncbi:thiolase family protein [Sphingomonas sp. KC8]|uniref:thiolase family protein n=1 Tax=Sphingomonas sp. KC8 TaxID=1030157 RepID=UPI000248984A|nr:thiolase family protein [Sphingomonas sp. KC8]ARS29419.1 transporter [Sphingomonas sp. KC8]
MGIKGDAAIIGSAQYRPERYATAPQAFHLDQVADLARLAVLDAGIDAKVLDGLIVTGSYFNEARQFVPAMVGEHLGIKLNFGEVIDLGGASAVGMAWRAAAVIELGLCEAVLCVIPMRLAPVAPGTAPSPGMSARFGGHSTAYGAPEAEFDIPYGHIAQNTGYAMIAQRYAAQYGYDPRAMAKIVVDQRTNACANPDAIFYGQPLTIDDVLNSRMVATPLHVLEIVMPVAGGAAFIVARKNLKRRNASRSAVIRGFGEHIQSKSPTYADDMLHTPIGPASRKAFEMSGFQPGDMHMAQIYDCYTITVLLSLEDAGFCPKGSGMRFVLENDLTYKGNFPMNTHGGQLGFGQAGTAGGMSQLIEAVHQIQGRCGVRQLARNDLAYVSGTGGVMSEQTALILQGA